MIFTPPYTFQLQHQPGRSRYETRSRYLSSLSLSGPGLSPHLRPIPAICAAFLSLLTASIQAPAFGQGQDWGYDNMDSPRTNSNLGPKSKSGQGQTSTVKNFEGKGANSAANLPQSERNTEKHIQSAKPKAQITPPKAESKAEPQIEALNKRGAKKNSDIGGRSNIGSGSGSSSREHGNPQLTTGDCWMELFAVCASSPSEDDRKILASLGTIADQEKEELKEFLNSREKLEAYSSLKPIWLQLRPKVLQELDYKDSYRLLFRALLRHALSDPRTNLSAAQKATIQNLMGPSRISEPGPPVLTEDAINAYADMTCFLFQRRKPDRSIDGEENRQVFADVIKQRYNQAPNFQAKAAMCNFDLTWACFRCRYLAMDEEGRARLSKLMAAGGGKELKAELTNPEILKIFALGPWSEKNKEQTAPLSQNTGEAGALPEAAKAQALPLK